MSLHGEPLASARLVVLLVAAGLPLGGVAPAQVQPWEIWGDLHRLPELHAGAQGLLRSSHCGSGCKFDRHSEGDSRMLYVDGEEGVVFEEAGAGAITRIWMTMGFGTSVPLDPEVRIRIYVDGAESPVVDVPLPALFDGSTPPFQAPLVGHRLDSSGGNYSYVPIPYRDGCRVVLVGAEAARIWFQFNFYRLAGPDGVESFTGTEDLAEWAGLLAKRGASPWTASEDWGGSSVAVRPSGPTVLARRTGPGSVTTLRLDLPPAEWPSVELLASFDGQERVRMPLADFFAVGRGGPLPTRSLLIGVDDTGRLYSYFPMPFRESMEIALRHLGPAGAPAVTVDYQVAGVESPPSPSSGLFGAALSVSEATEIGRDFPLLELAGEGKWVGQFVELGSVGTSDLLYLEGDERVFIDGSPHPAVYGTGVEDFYNAGFYFDQGPLSLALHGSPYPRLPDGAEFRSAAYRLMLSDPITFASSLRAGLEGGAASDLAMRVRSVAYFYQRDRPRLVPSDRLDLGDPGERSAHGYVAGGTHGVRVLDGLFEGEPPRALSAAGIVREGGEASFVLQTDPDATRFRLRRRFDAGLPGQAASILVDGDLVARLPPIHVNAERRWREIDVDLDVDPAAAADGELAFSVVASPADVTGGGTFTEFVYELWTDVEPPLFSDGFESGGTTAWSAVMPPFAAGAPGDGSIATGTGRIATAAGCRDGRQPGRQEDRQDRPSHDGASPGDSVGSCALGPGPALGGGEAEKETASPPEG